MRRTPPDRGAAVSSGELRLDIGHDRRVLGLHLGPVTRHDAARGRHEELLEVPRDVAGVALGVLLLRQLGVNRAAVVAVDVDLLHEREGHAIGSRAELRDLLGGAGLLPHELVAGEADDRETAVAVGLLQALETLVLGGEPALGRNVDEQQRLALVLAQRRVVALEGVDGNVVESHAATLSGTGSCVPGPRRVARMHAVVIRDTQLYWEERDDPVPGDTELLVAVHAAGLNAADLVQRAGFYPAPPGWPADIPGMEFAGEVVAVGRQVTLFTVGDRVMAVVGGGAQATLALVDESHALAVPEVLPWTEAGGFPEVFTTAYDALFRQAELQMGEHVLVSGAAGGVGTAGVQLAARAGAKVTATVRDPARRDAVAALGADVVLAPGDEAAQAPYDVVLELVGAPSLSSVLPHLATWGRVVVIGVGGGGRMEIELMDLMRKRISLGGSTLRARDRREKADVAADMTAHVLPALVAGRLQIPVYETFPLAEAQSAYDHFAAGAKFGKVVLVAP